MSKLIKAYSKKSFMEFYNVLSEFKTGKWNNIIYDVIKLPNLEIIFYNNLSIYFKGDIGSNSLVKDNIDLILDSNLYVGSDEVGIGEHIGPMVVTAVKFNSLLDKKKILLEGIKDSKKMTWAEVVEKVKIIKKHVKYECIILTPEKFNVLYQKINNVKAIMAIMHYGALTTFNSKYTRVIDEFVNSNKFYEYLITNKKIKSPSDFKNVIFKQRGEEKFLEIACAAIISKYVFNMWVISYLEENNYDLHIEKRLNSYDIYKKIINKKIPIDDHSKIVKNWKKLS